MHQYQLNTNTQNKYLQTPLHEAIASGVDDNCEYLIDKAIDIDQTGFMGLSGLHCAVIRGMINVSANLVTKGADYERYIEFSPQPPVNEIKLVKKMYENPTVNDVVEGNGQRFAELENHLQNSSIEPAESHHWL